MAALAFIYARLPIVSVPLNRLQNNSTPCGSLSTVMRAFFFLLIILLSVAAYDTSAFQLRRIAAACCGEGSIFPGSSQRARGDPCAPTSLLPCTGQFVHTMRLLRLTSPEAYRFKSSHRLHAILMHAADRARSSRGFSIQSSACSVRANMRAQRTRGSGASACSIYF